MGLLSHQREKTTSSQADRLQAIEGYFVVQSLSPVWRFVTPWTAAHQAPLSSTVSQHLFRFISIESVMLSSSQSDLLKYVISLTSYMTSRSSEVCSLPLQLHHAPLHCLCSSHTGLPWVLFFHRAFPHIFPSAINITLLFILQNLLNSVFPQLTNKVKFSYELS